MLTGSYHNYFRIYDTDTLSDVVLQADKSAFKAKKIGGPLPGAKGAAKNGPRPGGLRDAMQLDTLDFNKKILHASWHPRENTIAVSLCFFTGYDVGSQCYFCSRLLLRTICSSIALHNRVDDTTSVVLFTVVTAIFLNSPSSYQPLFLRVPHLKDGWAAK